jgi:hypothetical protein
LCGKDTLIFPSLHRPAERGRSIYLSIKVERIPR